MESRQKNMKKQMYNFPAFSDFLKKFLQVTKPFSKLFQKIIGKGPHLGYPVRSDQCILSEMAESATPVVSADAIPDQSLKGLLVDPIVSEL